MNHTTLPLLSLPASHLISFIIHFPHRHVTNIQSPQTCHSYLIMLIAFFSFSLPISFNFHHISSSPITLFFHCALFLLLFFSLPSSTICISFISFINHMIIINMPLKQTHSSFSIILCPHLIASLSYFFLCFLIAMGEQYSFSSHINELKSTASTKFGVHSHML